MDATRASSIALVIVSVIRTRVPGYQRSVVTTYRPEELILRTAFTVGAPPVQK
jgi:hypothetical protein